MSRTVMSPAADKIQSRFRSVQANKGGKIFPRSQKGSRLRFSWGRDRMTGKINKTNNNAALMPRDTKRLSWRNAGMAENCKVKKAIRVVEAPRRSGRNNAWNTPFNSGSRLAGFFI